MKNVNIKQSILNKISIHVKKISSIIYIVTNENILSNVSCTFVNILVICITLFSKY